MVVQQKEIVIPKEDAVFWMDAVGRWHNRHGPFEHAKIIDYFHSSIRKDELGYHLYQEKDGIHEKVYFKYEDTPLLVFDIEFNKQHIVLVLNTKKRMVLDPEKLIVRGDNLYVEDSEGWIRFAEKGLLKISECLEGDDNHYAICINGRTHPIHVVE